MTFLSLKYPILQAPLGSIGSNKLASAVSNAGGMGSLALTWMKPDVAAQRVRELRDNTDNLFSVNFILTFPLVLLEAALEAGAPVITFSWGQPGKLIDKVHKYNSIMVRLSSHIL